MLYSLYRTTRTLFKMCWSSHREPCCRKRPCAEIPSGRKRGANVYL